MQDRHESPEEALAALEGLRKLSFRAFGKRAEFSDAVWFPTWSGTSVGGRLARSFLSVNISTLLRLAARVLGETIGQGLIKSRQPVFHLPDAWLKADTEVVIQTWRDLESARQPPKNGEDRFFGRKFTEEASKGGVAWLDIITDNADWVDAPSFVVARSKTIYRFNPKVITECLAVFLGTIPGLIKGLVQAKDRYQRLALVVIWCALPNQRSRHAWSLWNFLQKSSLAKSRNLPKLMLPYETHPEQNVFAHFWQNHGGRTIGYIHGTMLTFPAHYLRPLCGAVDEIWIHGDAYTDILVKMGWDRNTIVKTPSLRFSKTRAAKLNPKPFAVYFPYWSGILRFPAEEISKAVATGKLHINELKPHPATGLHPKIKQTFEKFLLGSKTELEPGQLISIGPVSVPLEELERDTPLEVIHIPLTDSKWDSFDTELWRPYLNITPLFPKVAIYKLSLRQKGAFIRFDS